ncbi:MAG TPA: PAS domain S-box protein [Acidobacteriota bacterium]|nr:PAS domain S-box protein [Acidobacteriota bacterium]
MNRSDDTHGHKLAESELRYRELFENANDVIYTLDLAGNITSVNQAGEKTSGYTRAEAVTLNMSQVVAPEYLDKSNELIRRAAAGERLAPTEIEILAKDGRRIALEISVHAIFREGRPAGIQGIARDVNGRKLLERQLLQSQKMEAIGRLVGGVAHDFNNLLTVIVGYCEMLLSAYPENDPRRNDLDQVKKAGERAADLTSKLLAFSRRQILQPRVIDLNGVVSDNVKLLRRLIGEDIELKTSLANELGKVKADPGQIEQVIMNLAVNSKDAMPRGGTLVVETATVVLDESFVRSHAGAQQGNYVMLALRDSGTGMDEETKRHLFEPFYTTKGEGKGTGLGLASVYGIIKQSGGYIAVDTGLGHGTTFSIYLPQVSEPVTVSQPSEPLAPSGSETILVVEDAEDVRRLIGKSLTAFGYRVLLADNATNALRIAEDHEGRINLLVTDVIMPGMGGRELADRLQRAHPKMKVLLVSGYSDASGVGSVLSADIPFLHKPFTGENLSRKIREILG